MKILLGEQFKVTLEAMNFQVFVDKVDKSKDAIEVLMEEIISNVGENKLNIKVWNIAKDDEAREAAEKYKVDEVPALLLENVRISGQINEYFLLACIAHILTADGDDQKTAKIVLDDDSNQIRMKIASTLLMHQIHIRDETKTFLLLIREDTDEINLEKIVNYADNGATVFILTNFKNGSQGNAIAALGAHENILLGHILRSNIHMTLSITVRKGRPFFGAFIRGKNKNNVYTGKWSPLLHDTVSELKNFYVPLFQTASPIMLDGEIPEPVETNRLVAKVKDNIEVLRALFF
ncbi:MAG: hypothetical protein OEY49_18515 [Candidatus Heimdallarchaeota archaeon]|nr:hypothetical protein [Candidatus Heimdallarchaeota archaeon]